MAKSQEVEHATTWQEDVESAKEAMVSSAHHAIDAGKFFKSAKEKHREQFGGVGWGEAVEAMGVSRSIADQFVRVFDTFGEELRTQNMQFSTTVLRLLAAPKVDGVRDVVVTELQERAGSGEEVTVGLTQDVIEQYIAQGREQQIHEDRKYIERANENVAKLKDRVAVLKEDLVAKDKGESTSSEKTQQTLDILEATQQDKINDLENEATRLRKQILEKTRDVEGLQEQVEIARNRKPKTVEKIVQEWKHPWHALVPTFSSLVHEILESKPKQVDMQRDSEEFTLLLTTLKQDVKLLQKMLDTLSGYEYNGLSRDELTEVLKADLLSEQNGNHG